MQLSKLHHRIIAEIAKLTIPHQDALDAAPDRDARVNRFISHAEWVPYGRVLAACCGCVDTAKDSFSRAVKELVSQQYLAALSHYWVRISGPHRDAHRPMSGGRCGGDREQPAKFSYLGLTDAGWEIARLIQSGVNDTVNT